MSIARSALRIASVLALRDRTWAGDRVMDSDIGPIDKTAHEGQGPFISVYTDDVTVAPVGEDLLRRDGMASLVFEVAATARMNTDDLVEIPPFTDAGMEFALDMIERQILLALTDPDNDWGEIWRNLVTQFGTIKSKRGASAEDGVRFAARQITIEVQTLRDPTPTGAITGVWHALITKLEEREDGLENYASRFRMALGETDPVSGWKAIAQTYGLGVSGAEALLQQPAGGADDETEFSEIDGEAEPAP